MLGFLLKLISNPTTWIVAGVAAFSIFVASLMLSNNNLAHRNDLLKQDNIHKQEIIKLQERNIKLLENDVLLLDKLEKSKQQVVIKQAGINQKLNAIPKTSQDKPFSDSNLLNSARVLRDYQQSAYPDNSTDNSN